MKLAYAYPEHLGQPAARVLQTAATLRALARQGALVHFLAGWFAGLPGCLRQLGLAELPGLKPEPLPMWQPGPGLPLVFSWHAPFHWAAAARLRRLAGQGVGWVMVRHLKLADFLLTHRRGTSPRLLFEAHELFSQTALEEGQDTAQVEALRALEQRVFAQAGCLVAISQPLAQALEARPEVRAPVAVAPSGVEEEFFSVPQDQRQADLVAYAGGLGPWKGVDLLLRAVARTPRARLEVLGGRPGHQDWLRLEGLARELGLGQRFTLRPRAGQDAVRELLGRAQVAVWPGTGRQRIAAEFTSPLKLFEYLAAGCAVVAPDVPAARSVVDGERQAALFAPDDEAALAQTLEALLGDASRAAALGRAGRQLARRYTWDARAQTLLAAMAESRP